jgi:hypothetical protein
MDIMMANVVVISDDEPGYLVLWDCETMPDVSHLNYGANSVESNFVMASMSPSDDLCLTMSTPGDVVIDVFGWASNAEYYQLP